MPVDLSFLRYEICIFWWSDGILAIRSPQTQSKWCRNEFGLFQVRRNYWLNDFYRKHSNRDKKNHDSRQNNHESWFFFVVRNGPLDCDASADWKNIKAAHLLRVLQQNGIYTYLIRIQNFLFHSPFDEIYRRLLFFTLGRSISAWIDYTSKWNRQTRQHQGKRPTWSPVYVHCLVCLARVQNDMSC